MLCAIFPFQNLSKQVMSEVKILKALKHVSDDVDSSRIYCVFWKKKKNKLKKQQLTFQQCRECTRVRSVLVKNVIILAS